jgi:hypothetical protein
MEQELQPPPQLQELLRVRYSGGFSACVRSKNGKIKVYNTEENPYALSQFPINNKNRYYFQVYLVWRSPCGEMNLHCFKTVRSLSVGSIIQKLWPDFEKAVGTDRPIINVKLYDITGQEITDLGLHNIGGKAQAYPMPVYAYAFTFPVYRFSVLHVITPFQQTMRVSKGRAVAVYTLCPDGEDHLVSAFKNLDFEGTAVMFQWVMESVVSVLLGAPPSLDEQLKWRMELVFLHNNGDPVIITSANELSTSPPDLCTAAIIMKYEA